jgi:cytochrome c biogenesis protein CcdA
MESLWIGLGSAFWLGILTSISPCPLATNIAALSYISKDVTSTWRVFTNGVLYTVGRATAYTLISIVIVTSLISAFEAAQFLQSEMNRMLGPLLVVAGLVILNVIPIPRMDGGWAGSIGHRVAAISGVGPLLLGALFALAFCPVSAGLFFGSLIPLAVGAASAVVLPSCFGLGTAVPVLGISVLLASGAKSVGSVFGKLNLLEVWARRLTGAIFMGVGFYLSWFYLL